jgi:hypothetical protein
MVGSLCWAILFSSSPAVASEVVDTVERSFTVEGRPSIIIKNVDGNNRIVAGSGSQVSIRAVKEVSRAGSSEEAKRAAEKVEVRIEQFGDRIEIQAKYPKRWSFLGLKPRILVHFEVTAPAASDLEAVSVDGALDVEGFDGRLELSTADGDLTVHHCRGVLSARTVDGDLSLGSSGGEVRARTVDGKLSIEGIMRALEASSTDGRVEIRAAPGSTMGKDWSIRTSDGDIRLGLPEGFEADIDIETDDGRINSEHPVSIEGSVSRNKLRGKLNDGGNLLRIRSSDGDVTIERR